MPVFKNVGLNSAPLAHAVVVEFAETLLSAVVGPIVRREDDEHILCQVQQTECIQRKADVVIDLKDKFAIGPGFVFAYEGVWGTIGPFGLGGSQWMKKVFFRINGESIVALLAP